MRIKSYTYTEGDNINYLGNILGGTRIVPFVLGGGGALLAKFLFAFFLSKPPFYCNLLF